ncbi:codanin-1-like isoform X2 [Ptychodera flava]|uniref:codanin-1-like isoform X2 n=1 Tax=Ptychodera flava TaxID=63121 RepID=UPI00396A93D4
MAASLLNLVLDGKIQPSHVISWLTGKNELEHTFNFEFTNGNMKADFIAYILNYLREQSMAIIASSQSSINSPVKTPRSLGSGNKSLRNKKISTVSNRVNLFPSQLTNEKTDGRKASQSSKDNASSCDEPTGISPLDISTSTPKSCKSEESFTSPCVYSPYSPYFEGTTLGSCNLSAPKSIQKGSLSHTSPEILSKGHKKKVATVGHHDDKRRDHLQHQPSPSSRRKSGNKRSNQDLKERRKEIITESAPILNLQLDNVEDFPPISAQSSSKVIASRRIKPTPVTGDRLHSRTQKCFTAIPVLVKSNESPTTVTTERKSQFSTPEKKKSSLSNETNSITSPKNLEEERELLRIARQQQKLDNASNNFSSSSFEFENGAISLLSKQCTPTKPPVSCLFKAEIMEAKRENVTYIDQLDALVELYCGCIKEVLFPSITVELYFLIQLLTVKGHPEDVYPGESSDSNQQYLHTVHNCVYFAITAMSKLYRLLAFLDKATLRLLSGNPRVSEFSSDMKSKLVELSEASCSTGYNCKISSVPGVAFQADTDNRTNFPDNKSFHLFRKQRDIFYELIREWEDNHHKPGWIMKAAMAQKIWQLIHQELKFANCAHFVRLFQSQLMKMCKGHHSIVDDMNNSDDMEFLQHLKKNNPEKLKRLQERLITPLSHGGPSPSPTFTGPEEFFHDFIVIADSHIFNQHLMESLSAKILQITGVDLSLPINSINGNDGPTLAKEQRDIMQSGILSSKLLGKFLGLLVFLPYQSSEKLPNGLQKSLLIIRNECSPPLDILHELQTSMERNQLIVTLPWVIDYLSMMDSVAPYLHYYQNLLDLLLQIYKVLSELVSTSLEIKSNYLFMLLLLGWLFEIPVFPERFFFKLYDLHHTQLMNNFLKSSSSGLDSIDLIDTHVLYLCCPYLGEVRVLLLEAAAGMKSQGGTVKKITPTSADHVEGSSLTKTLPSRLDRRLQLLQKQMVENFYHNHPQSVQKTVDFISERVASNCKEQIENRLLVGLIQTELSNLTATFKVMLTQDKFNSDMMQRRVREMLPKRCRNVILTVNTQCKRYCQNKCYKAIKLVLSESTKAEVLTAASIITSEIAYEKLHPWIHKEFAIKMEQYLLTEINKVMLETVSANDESSHRQSRCEMTAVDGKVEENKCESDYRVVKEERVHTSVQSSAGSHKHNAYSLEDNSQNSLCALIPVFKDSWQGVSSLLQIPVLNSATKWDDVETKLLIWIKATEDITVNVTKTILDWMQTIINQEAQTTQAEDMMELLAMLLLKTEDLESEGIPACFENIIIL